MAMLASYQCTKVATLPAGANETATPQEITPGMAIPTNDTPTIERVQTGVRLEKRLLKVLKALAEYHDISLGDLLEGIVLHVFEGRLPFDTEMQGRIAELKRLYNLDLGASSSHRYAERGEGPDGRAGSAMHSSPALHAKTGTSRKGRSAAAD